MSSSSSPSSSPPNKPQASNTVHLSKLTPTQNFLVLVRVLTKYLEKVHPPLAGQVQNVIKDCQVRHKQGQAGYENLTTMMLKRLKEVVPDEHWTRSETYLVNYLGKKKAEQQQQQPRARTPPPGIPLPPPPAQLGPPPNGPKLGELVLPKVKPHVATGLEAAPLSLALLLHAGKCPHLNKNCKEPYCQDAKRLRLHMNTCKVVVAGTGGCLVPHCDEARELLHHWQHCQRLLCPKCRPARMEMGMTEVEQHYKQVLDKLEAMEDAWIFDRPVDWVALDLPDYLEVVKEPMDFGTIRIMLDKKEIQSPDHFCQLVHRTLDNAMTYNPVGTKVYEIAKRVKQAFRQCMEG